MSPPYRVALVVIARDEAPRIQRLLDSMRPWVDDMLVVDTGSKDATVSLAQAAGARVAHFDWCDDFAAARNHALDLAAADWHVVLDADEWLIDGGESLMALRQLAPDHVGALQLQDEFDQAGAHPGLATVWLSRVLPGGVRYGGRIHEQPLHQLPVKRLPLRVGHDGYRDARLTDKRGRNRRLLERSVREHPHDAYLWFQLGKDHAVYDEPQAAEAAFAQAEACLAASPVRPSWWLDFCARRLFGLKQLKQHVQGVDFAQAQIDDPASGVLASPDFHFALGDLLLDAAADAPEEAASLVPLIEQAWRQCLALGERPDQSGAVAGRGSHLAAHNLALLLDACGRTDEAAALRAEAA